MNCSELIDLYNKVGGVLTCNYRNKTISVDGTNLKCNINLTTDKTKIFELYNNFCYSPYDVEELTDNKMTISEITDFDIKIYNPYLKNNQYGFKITYLDK
jgi:hypothetical protein